MGKSKRRLRRDYQKRRRDRIRAINASMVEPITPELHRDWRQNWIRADQNNQNNWSSKRRPRPGAYGTFWDWDMKLNEQSWNNSGEFNAWVEDDQNGRKLPMKPMPIHGPLDWDQVWKEWPEIGTDHTGKHDEEQTPLPEDQMKRVNDYSNKYEIVKWERKISMGAFGNVWEVRCRRVGVQNAQQERMACKVIKAVTGGINQKTMTMMEGIRLLVKDINIGMWLSWVTQNMPETIEEGEQATGGEVKEIRPNIIRYLDVITIPDQTTYFPYSATLILMPLCQGNLNDMVERFRSRQDSKFLSIPMCKHWMKQMSEAVAFLHKNNIVHLDIKPQNILVQFPNPTTQITVQTIANQWQDIKYLLTDFSLARKYIYGEEQDIDKKAGTRDFMAPELSLLALRKIRQETQKQYNLPIEEIDPVLTKPCDVYSLGATLIYCRVDKGTYLDYQNAQELETFMGKILNKAPSAKAFAKDVTPELAEFIRRLVYNNPKERLTIEQVIADPFLAQSEQNQAPL